MSGDVHSRRPDKSNSEELRTQLTDDHIREQVFDVLAANPETRFSYRDLGELLDKDYQGVRAQIKKMQKRTFEVQGEEFDGIVNCVRDGKTKMWQLDEGVHDVLEEPRVETVEETKYETIEDFYLAHWKLVGSSLFLVVFGVLFELVELIAGQYLGSVEQLIWVGGLAGVVWMTVIGLGEVRT